MKQLRILLVNEAGCFSPGITALAKVLSAKHRVVIVAPLSPLKSVGAMMTASAKPLRVDQFFVLNKVKIFGVNGTPCDCVHLALDKVLKSTPDVIISGIDHGNSRGETIYTSGVVSAAIAGTVQGIKSIAVSAKVADENSEKSYMPVARAFARKLPMLLQSMAAGTTLNVNFPRKYSATKIKCTPLTTGIVDNKYEFETNPAGTVFFWLTNSGLRDYDLNGLNQQGDIYWLKKNFATVTPLKLDLTDYDFAAKLSQVLDSEVYS